MIIHSDWHIHSQYSYDASLPLEVISQTAKEYGFCKVGITDHLNFNDEKFLGDLKNSAEAVKEFQKTHPNMVLGVELTPIETDKFKYIARTGTRDGYVPTPGESFEGIELAQTKEQLMAYGVRYAVGAAHWCIKVHGNSYPYSTLEEYIQEWHRQQMWLACDERVTILGHPWYHPKGFWYADFSVIPASMHQELAAALKEHGKYMECNGYFFVTSATTEKFRNQYAQYLRQMHELGIPITYGSDSHNAYSDCHVATEEYLAAAGFRDGEIVEVAEKDFW